MDADTLRGALVDRLRDDGAVREAAVEAALRAVPRHLFVPGVPLDRAYADDVVSTKKDGAGASISAASQPAIVALMLEQLAVRPGDRVLEIGAGTGYNAALLATLAGPGGAVTTVDVDRDIVDGARAALDRAGYPAVRVVLGDGAHGHPEGAPYERLIATVGVWDPPDAWLDQLAPDGVLVMPLRIRGGISQSIAFGRVPEGWRSRSARMCGFMPLRGVAGDADRAVPLTPGRDVVLHVHRDQTVEDGPLRGVLARPPTEIWTGVRFAARGSFESLWLWLTGTVPGGLSRLTVTPAAVRTGLVRARVGALVMASATGGGLAYLTLRPAADGYELGVVDHGGPGPRLADAVRTWDTTYRDRPIGFTLQALDEPAPPVDGYTVAKAYHRLIVSWG
jgi:protein-L-isoaspartate(D-aspartate) O-methyltransferase